MLDKKIKVLTFEVPEGLDYTPSTYSWRLTDAELLREVKVRGKDKMYPINIYRQPRRTIIVWGRVL